MRSAGGRGRGEHSVPLLGHLCQHQPIPPLPWVRSLPLSPLRGPLCWEGQPHPHPRAEPSGAPTRSGPSSVCVLDCLSGLPPNAGLQGQAPSDAEVKIPGQQGAWATTGDVALKVTMTENQRARTGTGNEDPPAGSPWVWGPSPGHRLTGRGPLHPTRTCSPCHRVTVSVRVKIKEKSCLSNVFLGA